MSILNCKLRRKLQLPEREPGLYRHLVADVRIVTPQGVTHVIVPMTTVIEQEPDHVYSLLACFDSQNGKDWKGK